MTSLIKWEAGYLALSYSAPGCLVLRSWFSPEQRTNKPGTKNQTTKNSEAMKILVANLGSTSYKYRLYSMTDSETSLSAKGGYERLSGHGEAIEDSLNKLQESGHLDSLEDLDAVGFKTVSGKGLSGCVKADDKVIAALDGFKDVAPAHNPAYAAGIRQFQEKAPSATLVALFETAFYQWMSDASVRYAVPQEWHDAGIRRYGFHGASHKFVAERSAELLGREDVADVAKALYQKGPQDFSGKAPVRVVSCHLGGSSSVAGIRNGVSIGASMGFSPQSGLPQNNRVGDLDSMAIPYAAKNLGITVEEAEKQLTTQGGLLGISGVSNDLRDIRDAEEKGNTQATQAIEVLIHQIRHWAGSFIFQMGGVDAIVFTAGIGENGPDLRRDVCEGSGDLGIEIDDEKNQALMGEEGEISSANSRVKIFVIPANEEVVIGREVYRFMKAKA